MCKQLSLFKHELNPNQIPRFLSIELYSDYIDYPYFVWN